MSELTVNNISKLIQNKSKNKNKKSCLIDKNDYSMIGQTYVSDINNFKLINTENNIQNKLK